jgi:NH3-dependent NAD+ synthetase
MHTSLPRPAPGRSGLPTRPIPHALLGLSGEIDRHCRVLAVAAIGGENVLGVSMPGPYSSTHSVTDAHDLARRLGMQCVDAPIALAMDGLRGMVDPVFRSIGRPTLGATLPDATEENIQARIRGTMLMALSNRTGRSY